MEKTRRPDGTGRKKGNGNRSIYAEKKQERKNRRPLEKERLAEEGAQSEKQKLPVKRKPSFNKRHFWGIKERGPWQNQREREIKENIIRKKGVSVL